MTQQATARDVAVELTKLGYVVQLLPADPPNALVESINVWRGSERYPTDTVWAPMPKPTDGEQGLNFMWAWGPNFDYSAPPEATAGEVAAQVVATVLS